MNYFAFTASVFCFFPMILSNGTDSGERERERIASLIVLPPIIIGYDEIYDEEDNTPKLRSNVKTETKQATDKELEKIKTDVKTTPARKKLSKLRSEGKSEKIKHLTRSNTKVQTMTQNKTMRRPPVRKLNLPWEKLVAYEDPAHKDSIIIPQQRLVLQRTAHGKTIVRNNKINTSKHIKIDNIRKDHMADYKYFNKEEKSENNHRVGRDGTVEDIENNDPTVNEVSTENKDPVEHDDPIEHKNLLGNKVDNNIQKEGGAVYLPAQGVIADDKKGEILNFEGKFLLPKELFN
ncbi:hypothetical protein O0L34_g7934 [Tuta absoluta]|nr:hypothetical protein O0L34_g7934 [Tuta absoluta]